MTNKQLAEREIRRINRYWKAKEKELGLSLHTTADIPGVTRPIKTFSKKHIETLKLYTGTQLARSLRDESGRSINKIRSDRRKPLVQDAKHQKDRDRKRREYARKVAEQEGYEFKGKSENLNDLIFENPITGEVYTRQEMKERKRQIEKNIKKIQREHPEAVLYDSVYWDNQLDISLQNAPGPIAELWRTELLKVRQNQDYNYAYLVQKLIEEGQIIGSGEYHYWLPEEFPDYYSFSLGYSPEFLKKLVDQTTEILDEYAADIGWGEGYVKFRSSRFGV